MIEQLLGLGGALLVLVAYAITVFVPRWLCFSYIISLLGGVALFVLAWHYQNIGLLILEFSWIAINAWGIVRHSRQKT